jgi:hypothetical protein
VKNLGRFYDKRSTASGSQRSFANCAMRAMYRLCAYCWPIPTARRMAVLTLILPKEFKFL